MSLRAVCFDLGGVVARITFSLTDMMSGCGLPAPRRLPSDDIHEMPGFWEYQAGEMTDEEYIEVLASYLGGISAEDAMRVHRSMIIEPFPGVLEIVEELNAGGVVTGCLSNTNAPHWRDLAESGRFPAIQAMKIRLASHLIDATKPDQRAFESFVEAAGCRPEEIILFDDSLINCEAAQALGWQATNIDPTANPARQMRHALDSVAPGALAHASG